MPTPPSTSKDKLVLTKFVKVSSGILKTRRGMLLPKRGSTQTGRKRPSLASPRQFTTSPQKTDFNRRRKSWKHFPCRSF